MSTFPRILFCIFIWFFFSSKTGHRVIFRKSKSSMGVAFLHVPATLVSLLWRSVHPDQCNAGATHSSRSLGEEEGGQSSHLVCHVVVLSCGKVAVGTDRGVVVLVTGGHESKAVGVHLLAGNPVSFSSLLLALAQLSIMQRLQHLSTDLQHTKQ